MNDLQPEVDNDQQTNSAVQATQQEIQQKIKSEIEKVENEDANVE